MSSHLGITRIQMYPCGCSFSEGQITTPTLVELLIWVFVKRVLYLDGGQVMAICAAILSTSTHGGRRRPPPQQRGPQQSPQWGAQQWVLQKRSPQQWGGRRPSCGHHDCRRDDSTCNHTTQPCPRNEAGLPTTQVISFIRVKGRVFCHPMSLQLRDNISCHKVGLLPSVSLLDLCFTLIVLCLHASK